MWFLSIWRLVRLANSTCLPSLTALILLVPAFAILPNVTTNVASYHIAKPPLFIIFGLPIGISALAAHTLLTQTNVLVYGDDSLRDITTFWFTLLLN